MVHADLGRASLFLCDSVWVCYVGYVQGCTIKKRDRSAEYSYWGVLIILGDAMFKPPASGQTGGYHRAGLNPRHHNPSASRNRAIPAIGHAQRVFKPRATLAGIVLLRPKCVDRA